MINNLDLFYLKDIKVMSEKELESSFKKYKNGDLKQRDKIIKSNLKLVVTLAKRYNIEGYDLEDVISIGNIGLIKAVDTYDIDRNIKFSTYAARCINNEILMSIRRNQLKKGNFQVVNINDPIVCDYDGNELKYIDIIEDKNSDFIVKIIDDYLSQELLSIIDSLSEKEKNLVFLYFGFDGHRYKQKEIAEKLGISQSYISRLISDILKKIKVKIMKEDSLDDFAKKLTKS